MATRFRRPSALRKLTKQFSTDNDSEEMSASPSPSEWIKRVKMSQSQQQFDNHMICDDDDDDDNNMHNNDENQFCFTKQPMNEYQEIIDENEESEMESEYVETEVSEEEIREIEVPVETEIEVDDSESCSDYTSIASASPVITKNNDNNDNNNEMNKINFRNQAKRRQSMPNLAQPQKPKSFEINHSSLSPLNDENRPPSTPLRLQTVNEEQKDKEQVNEGSMDRSEIFNQSVLQSNHLKKKKQPKQSILPIQKLQFDDTTFESPAPPSILLSRNKANESVLLSTNKKVTIEPTPHDTPHFSNVHDNLAYIDNLVGNVQRSNDEIIEKEQQQMDEKEKDNNDNIDDIEPSPLGCSRESSVLRKEVNHNISGCAQNVNDGLDGMLKHLKEMLPSPAVNNAPKEVIKKPSTKKKNDKEEEPQTRRRSARIAKKHKARAAESEDANDEESEYANISIRKRTRRRNKRKQNETKQTKESSQESAVSSGNEADEEDIEHPYIDDDNMDSRLVDDIPLPSTKVVQKSKTKINAKKKKQKQKQPPTPQPQSEDEEDEEEDIIMSTKRSRGNKGRSKRIISNVSSQSNNESIISGVSGISPVSSRRTRTLRSRKNEKINSPFSDDNEQNDEEEEHGTFDTPKKKRNASNRSKKSKQQKAAKKSPKAKAKKGKKASPKKQLHKEKEEEDLSQIESEIVDFSQMDDGNHNNHNGNDDIDMEMQPFEDDNFDQYDSPNLNENDDEKQEIETQRSDDGETETIKSAKTNKSKKKKTTNKSKKNTKKKAKKDATKKTKKKSKKKKESKTKKTKKKKSRKRKVYETDISYSSDEPDKKRPRLSQIVQKPTSVPPEEPNVRRSRRVRFKPMEWWRNERVDNYDEQPLQYEDVKDKGLEGGLQYDPGTNDAQPKFHMRSKTKRSRRTKSKSKKTKSSKRSSKKKKDRDSSPEPMSEDDEGDDDDNTPFDGTAWIYDSKNDKMTQNCVVKTKKCINLVPLGRPEENEEGNGNGNNGEEEPVSKRVRGAKGLEEEGFSCGVLEIPPESQKHAEISYFTEQFFVHQCERKQLLFKLGEDEFLLSRGSMFYVPPENEYSLKNLSKTHPVKLIFTLIKADNKMDDDTQTQMSTQNTPLR